MARDLEYKVEPISGADHYYTDGLSVGSFLKLVIHSTSIYLFPSGLYLPCGYITQDQKSILDGWVETCKSKKLNLAKPISEDINSAKENELR